MILDLATTTLIAVWGPGSMKQAWPWMEINKKTYNFPASKNPILRLDENMCTSSTKCLDAGDYEVTISGDNKFLVLLQGNEIKARVPVLKLTTLASKKTLPVAEKIDEKTGYVYFIYEKDFTRAVGAVKVGDR